VKKLSARSNSPAAVHFARLLPESPLSNQIFFQIASGNVDAQENRIGTTKNEGEQKAELFDRLRAQYFELARQFGFDNSPDAVYRFVQGALVNWAKTLDLQMSVRINRFQNTPLYPESDHRIRDMSYVVKNSPGEVLDKFGTPIVIQLTRDMSMDMVNDPLMILPAAFETESDVFWLVKIGTDRPHPYFLPPRVTASRINSMAIATRKELGWFSKLVMEKRTQEGLQLDTIYDVFDGISNHYGQRKDVLSAYLLGKLLIPDYGFQSFKIEVFGPGARGIAGDLFLLTKAERSIAVAISAGQRFDERLFTKVVEGPLEKMGIQDGDAFVFGEDYSSVVEGKFYTAEFVVIAVTQSLIVQLKLQVFSCI